MKKEELLKSFGKHLKKVRIQKGISLGELGLRVEKVDKQLLSKIETGQKNPTLFTIAKICEGLEIELNDFFKDYGKKR